VYVLNGNSLGEGVGLIGARYSPSSNVWTVLPRAPISQRANVVSLWTGYELIVWGGNLASGAGARDGAAFDPATNQWRRVADAPIGGTNASAAVWTGTEMIVWGAGLESDQSALGLAYNPATDNWRRLAQAPIANRPYPSAVWTGKEMVVWGGCTPNPPSNPGPCDHYSGNEPTDGAAYNPTTNVWRRLPVSPLPPRARPHAVWTGTEMIIWGSDAGPAPGTKVGASYNPSTNSWRLLPSAPISPLRDFIMLWTGEEAVVVGGQSADRLEGQRAAYHPDTRTWSVLPAAPFAWTGSAFAWSNQGLVGLSGSGFDWTGALLTP
jgi:N-acetylneuraminic acid mutarotase